MVIKNSCGQTITQYNVQTGDAANNLNQVSPSTATYVLTSNGVLAQPSFQPVTASGATTSIDVDAHTAPGTDPVVPASGVIAITGAQVATGTIGANVIRTDSLAANAFTIEVQQSTTSASKDTTKNGVAHFKSADFTVDQGFVSLANPNPPPNSLVQFSDDFIVGINVGSTGLTGNFGWASNVGPVTSATGDSAHPGVFGMSPGGGATVYIIGGSTTDPIYLGGGVISCNWVFNVIALSANLKRYSLNIGLGDTITGNDEANGVYLKYIDNANSGKWQFVTAAASSRTTSNSAVAVTTGWHNAGVVINAAASSVEFFMDGVSLGTIITNIPTLPIFPTFKANPDNGAFVPSATTAIDLVYLTINLTTPR